MEPFNTLTGLVEGLNGTLESLPQTSTISPADRWAAMIPQQLAEAGAKVTGAHLDRQIERISRGEVLPEQ